MRSGKRSGRQRRRAYAAVVAVLAVIAGGLATGALDPDSQAAPVIPRNAVRLDVSARPIGPPIPAGFVGFSIEYSSLYAYAGRDPAAVNPVFIRLIRTVGGERPVLRFGGDTTDWTWWPVPGAARPGGIRYALGSRWVAVARATARAAHARLILGVNLEADSGLVAQTEARELLHGLGRHVVAEFELGNEPEVYGSIAWYHGPGGEPVVGRPPTYDFGWFLHDYAAVGSELAADVPLAGPASGAPVWVRGVNRFLAADPRTRLVTYHFYPLRRCYTPSSSPISPTLSHLLSARAAAVPPDIRAAVRSAHSHGLRLRLDEFNSVSCKGQPGVSNTFASALWAIQALFHLARAGVDGVNIHTLNDVPYEPFSFSRRDGRWRASVRPLYYGLLAFGRAAPPGSRLLTTTFDHVPGLGSWAVVAPDGSLRVMLVNVSRRHRLLVAVRPPHAGADASLQRLSAPSATATSDVSLAGQSYGTSTATGKLAGTLQAQTVVPLQRHYLVVLPPASAALLTWR